MNNMHIQLLKTGKIKFWMKTFLQENLRLVLHTSYSKIQKTTMWMGGVEQPNDFLPFFSISPRAYYGPLDVFFVFT